MYNGSERQEEYAHAVSQHVRSFTVSGRPNRRLPPTRPSAPTQLAQNDATDDETGESTFA